jgi:hypothetical protein
VNQGAELGGKHHVDEGQTERQGECQSGEGIRGLRLLAAELPLTGWWWGSSPSSWAHSMLMSAGLNWHLFDTIDVVRHATGDTVHLSVAPLTVLNIYPIALDCTEQLPVGGVFIFVGFRPNTGLVKGHITHDAAGHLITNEHMMTSMPGLFAAGDVRSQLTRQVTTAVGDATTAVIAAARYLAEMKRRQGARGA